MQDNKSLEALQREAVVRIAYEHIGESYHHMARVKGVASDCATFLCMVYEEAGITGHIELDYYPQDWALHRGEERYHNRLMDYCRQVETPQRGDIVMFRFGRCLSHGAIVLNFPEIIHSFVNLGCVKGSAIAPQLSSRIAGFYSPWGVRE